MGIPYLKKVLRDKKTVISRALFWRIHHASGREEVNLKIGRYKKPKNWRSEAEADILDPKSELTLDDLETRNLIEFLSENYEPFKEGVKSFISINNPLDGQTAKLMKSLLNNPDIDELMKFITEHDVIPEHLVLAIHHKNRLDSISEFEKMLIEDLTEPHWQKWLKQNSWVLGTEFVRVLDERVIDTSHISDFLMQAYDGFLDIVEIKRPGGGLNFWASKLDHGNYVPSTDVIKAITQASHYIYEVEREANSVKFQERVDGVRTIKPRCTLIFGRSHDWNDEQLEAYRILNASYHSLTILTYDHVLDRANRLLKSEDANEDIHQVYPDEKYDVPF